jgi:hypothetical protein
MHWSSHCPLIHQHLTTTALVSNYHPTNYSYYTYIYIQKKRRQLLHFYFFFFFFFDYFVWIKKKEIDDSYYLVGASYICSFSFFTHCREAYIYQRESLHTFSEKKKDSKWYFWLFRLQKLILVSFFFFRVSSCFHFLKKRKWSILIQQMFC